MQKQNPIKRRKSGPDRDEHGRFVKGHSLAGPGRPPLATEQQYLETTISWCSLDAWEAIVQRAVEDAAGGDAKARDWLSRYLLPAKPTDLRVLMDARVDTEAERNIKPLIPAETLAGALAELENLGYIQRTELGLLLPDPSRQVVNGSSNEYGEAIGEHDEDNGLDPDADEHLAPEISHFD